MLFAAIGLTTRPLLMQRVQTLMRLTSPLMSARTRWMLGRNFRRVCPVVLRPMPPCFLGSPRRAMDPPLSVRFLQISQTRAISFSSREEPGSHLGAEEYRGGPQLASQSKPELALLAQFTLKRSRGLHKGPRSSAQPDRRAALRLQRACSK
jgi:hypothetical protein